MKRREREYVDSDLITRQPVETMKPQISNQTYILGLLTLFLFLILGVHTPRAALVATKHSDVAKTQSEKLPSLLHRTKLMY